MVAPYSWDCPHCGRAATISDRDRTEREHTRRIHGDEGFCIETEIIRCPNPVCREFTVTVHYLTGSVTSAGSLAYGDLVRSWQLMPDSKSKSFPDYVPKAVIEDYTEACLIAQLSPKASATLSRRCLQGMIRDFWKVSDRNLALEIQKIEDKVAPDTYQAILAVKNIGNIGAHMEKDIDLIVDVESHEAEMLIDLIETLIHDWYIVRETRRVRMEALSAAAAAKKEIRKAGKEAPTSGDGEPSGTSTLLTG